MRDAVRKKTPRETQTKSRIYEMPGGISERTGFLRGHASNSTAMRGRQHAYKSLINTTNPSGTKTGREKSCGAWRSMSRRRFVRSVSPRDLLRCSGKRFTEAVFSGAGPRDYRV